MSRQHDPQTTAGAVPPDSVEAAILRRRRVLKQAAWLGVPLILSLHGQAFAGKKKRSGGSGGMSGSVSTPP